MIPPPGRVPGRASNLSRSRVDEGGDAAVRGGIIFFVLILGFWGLYLGKMAKPVEGRGAHTWCSRGRFPGRAWAWCGRLGLRLRFSFGLLERVGENRSFGKEIVQFQEYFLKWFS